MNAEELKKRDEEMHALFKEGKSFSAIGIVYGISREAVRIRMKTAFGITGKDSPVVETRKAAKEATSSKLEAARAKKRQATIKRLFGCTEKTFLKINGKPFCWHDNKSKALVFLIFRSNAMKVKTSNVKFCLTFVQWWNIWQASGKYDQKGRTEYLMVRKNGGSGDWTRANTCIMLRSDHSMKTRARKSKPCTGGVQCSLQ